MLIPIARRLIRLLGFDLVRYPRNQDLNLRYLEFEQNLIERTAESVVGGPFSGMKISQSESWGMDGVSKILGYYEQELYESIENIVKSTPDVVVNVGCAEGFYAVGLAIRLPNSSVIAIDTDRKAQELCKRAANKNGVQLEVRSHCSKRDLETIAKTYLGRVDKVDSQIT